jgi:acetyl-CoA carboxylase biotin carboxyl carrier protein
MDETTKGPSAATAGDPIDTRLVRRLAAILNDTGLTEIQVEKGDLKIRVAREPAPMAAPIQYAQAPSAMAAPMSMPSDPGAPPAATPPPAEPKGEPVKSPMVGTVYLQSSPGSEPFVRAGSRVSAGQTLLIIEAMKTMNPIAAPRDGVVLEVLAEDGQPVEFGEPLVTLE